MRVSRRHDFYLLLIFVLVFSTTVWASETENQIPPDRVAAIATDAPPLPVPSPEDVAREVLRLQEEMGGSIVSDFQPQAATGPAEPPPHGLQPWQRPRNSPVLALRQTAWQLEQSAHLLESLDLYTQADVLRETADMLRKDARKLKATEALGQAKSP